MPPSQPLTTSPPPDRALMEQWMEAAITEAMLADAQGDVPVGCVVIHNHTIIARAHNRREVDQDPTAHAEILALRRAADHLGAWRLGGCTVVVTLEPCTMCAGAIVLARPERLVFGATDPKTGACGSLYNVADDARLNHQPEIVFGILGDTCGTLLRAFFSRRRNRQDGHRKPSR